jgi:hypothetical protein
MVRIHLQFNIPGAGRKTGELIGTEQKKKEKISPQSSQRATVDMEKT